MGRVCGRRLKNAIAEMIEILRCLARGYTLLVKIRKLLHGTSDRFDKCKQKLERRYEKIDDERRKRDQEREQEVQ